ncbi:TIGR02530 family flagellar biosynthesis protein [Mediterraneibacter agrestimuris]|uniref:TIGR02530 family flagellar biosynthesis protein n=1 Tax=Mediterraneibacter agrestimuris TaxID=2941333 RepID=UPI00203A6CFE|nr:TIGR02530 family flagellar biosynthesis protein [Mediterraneibacter agrestimuris]
MSNQVNKLTNVNALKLTHAAVQTRKADDRFSVMLQEELNRAEGLRFSKHAAQRVQERGIEVSDSLMSDLNQAVEKAKAKGARDVVIIGKDGAFIVNVPHNLVVTTMNGTEMKDNIFTNIDSAVLL